MDVRCIFEGNKVNKLFGILVDLVNVILEPSKRNPRSLRLCPGDAVIFLCDDIAGNGPLSYPHPFEALEQEAFSGSGRMRVKTTGWIRKGVDVGLVIAIQGDYAFLLMHEKNGWGWIDKQFLSTP